MNTLYSTSIQRIREPGWPRLVASIAASVWLAVLVSLWIIEPLYAVGVFLLVPVLLLFALYPQIALYGMALTFPFIDMQIVYGALNVPPVDIFGVLGLAGWLLRLAWERLLHLPRPERLRFPFWQWMVAFVLVGVASSVFNSFDMWASLKFTLRPLAFFYLVFILLPVQTATTEQLHRILRLFFWLSAALAVFGLLGYLVVDAPNFLARRVTPFGIGGFYLLAPNHNLIADMMILGIPLGFYFMLQAKMMQLQKLYAFATALMLLANVLTYSRSGWLALIVQLLILTTVHYRHHLKRLARYGAIAFTLALPVIVLMTIFTVESSVVESSNFNRTLLNEIALGMFVEEPLLGVGPGNFKTVVGANKLYIFEFVSPLDSHGFIQKAAAEMGALGLLTYLALLAMVLWTLWRAYQQNRSDEQRGYLFIALLLLAAGTMFFQLFQTSYYVAKFWYPLGVAVALALRYDTGKSVAEHKKVHKQVT